MLGEGLSAIHNLKHPVQGFHVIKAGAMHTDDPSPVYLQISRSARLPDPVKLARYEKSPELGPRPLFFSGGTALRSFCAELIRYTHNSIHLITPFDSGGSSAKLREAFHMPAVGDIRNRLMALAEQSFQGNPEIFELFAHRMAEKAPHSHLHSELIHMARGKHPLTARIPSPMRPIICSHLQAFLEQMPENFDLQGASIGNLVLAAAYLNHRRLFDPAIYTFSGLVQARGIVRPVVNQYRHLVAELASGEVRVGQHRLTGKETTPITAPVSRLYLLEPSSTARPASVQIQSRVRDLIRSAELICYSMGSFYSSLIANLLPKGVGEAVSSLECPKIYVPNTGTDPESRGLDPNRQTEILLSYLKADGPERIENRQVLTAVLVDRERGNYAAPVDVGRLSALGVGVIDYPLITETSAPLIDPGRLAEVLLSLT